MSRKGKRKQELKARKPKAPQPSLGRYYRHRRETFQKVFRWTGLGVGVLAVLVAAGLLLKHHSVALTTGDYLKEARRDMALGIYDQAIVNYHQAEYADPGNQRLKDEIAMANTRLAHSGGGSPQDVFSACGKVLQDDSTMSTALLLEAQLNNQIGDLNAAIRQAGKAFSFAEAKSDTPTALAGALVLESCYRQRDQFDSSASYGLKSVALANSVADPQTLMLAQAGAGFSLLRLGRLEQARSLFSDIVTRAGTSENYFAGIGRVGLASYFERSGHPDSAAFYAAEVESSLAATGANDVSAFAAQVRGRALGSEGDLTAAISELQNSLSLWRKFHRQAESIENLNDLAHTYQEQKDYFNARKYYYAASQLAGKYHMPAKNLYNADFNVRFLKFLSRADYLKAGVAGDSLIREYSLW